MIIDFETLPPEQALDYDICIIGSGPAGMSVALELMESGRRVAMIESGKVDYDGEIQELYEGDVVGFDHDPLDACRLRYLGGSSNCWNGWCAPFDAIDFEKRADIPHSGWPITRDDLKEAYLRAGEICEIGAHEFGDIRDVVPDADYPAFDQDRIELSYLRYSPPTRFGETYRSVWEAHPNFDLILGANATQILLDDDRNSVADITLSGLSGKSQPIRARRFVLACGGNENARLLLASNGQIEAGIGNQNDQVGRYFMEHPYAASGLIFANGFDPLLQKGRFIDGIEHRAIYRTGTALQRRKSLLSSILFHKPEPNADTLFSWGNRDLPDDTDETSKEVLLSQSEQAPNPSSRIMLSERRDRFGHSLALMDWRLGEIDKRCIVENVQALGLEYARLGMGRVKLADWLLDGDAMWGIGAGTHHMGTTRMGLDPKTSVVDENCKVHGLANLYMAGASVFTTSSWVNPTLTLMALAVRLADHLKQA
ncbi:MAG: GMC family oxidoreductase [Pseudomonadota bacterium]